MARIATNPTTRGFSGKFGNAMVFRTMRGKTFVSPVPKPADKLKQSEAQRTTRSNFREAAMWAQHILLDESKKAYYQARARALKLPNAYTAALTDYMRKGKVETSTRRNLMYISVRKPGFKVAEVNVSPEGDFQPDIKVYPRSLGWQIEVLRPPARTRYALNVAIKDYFGRAIMEKIEVE